MELEDILNSKWEVGFKDRGHGNGDYGIMINEKLIIECPSKEIAVHIIELHNESL